MKRKNYLRGIIIGLALMGAAFLIHLLTPILGIGLSYEMFDLLIGFYVVLFLVGLVLVLFTLTAGVVNYIEVILQKTPKVSELKRRIEKLEKR